MDFSGPVLRPRKMLSFAVLPTKEERFIMHFGTLYPNTAGARARNGRMKNKSPLVS
jgi:hypothetical protein